MITTVCKESTGMMKLLNKKLKNSLRVDPQGIFKVEIVSWEFFTFIVIYIQLCAGIIYVSSTFKILWWFGKANSDCQKLESPFRRVLKGEGTSPVSHPFFSKSHFAVLKSHSHFWIFTFVPNPSDQILVPVAWVPFCQGKKQPIPIPIFPFQHPLWGGVVGTVGEISSF